MQDMPQGDSWRYFYGNHFIYKQSRKEKIYSNFFYKMMMTARSAVLCRLLWEGWERLWPFPPFPQFVVVCCGKGGKVLRTFPTLSTTKQHVGTPVGRVGKSTDLFHAFHSRSERKPKRELFFGRTRKSEGENRPLFSLLGKSEREEPSPPFQNCSIDVRRWR